MSRFSLNCADSVLSALRNWPVRVFEKRDAAGHRRALHVNVNHGKKNGNALAFAAEVFRLGRGVNHIHLAVAGGDDEVGAGRARADRGRGKNRT